MRGAALAVGLAVLAVPGTAQTVAPAGTQTAGQAVAPQTATGPVLTLDQDRVFGGSAYGRATLAAIDSEIKALQAEDRKIEAALETEEKALTDLRPDLPADEFRALADAFDIKVKGIRAARDAKARELAAQRAQVRQRFVEAALPVLADIMAEQGASIILDRSAIILSFDKVDITDLAIARIDAVLGDGSTPPAPETTPKATVEPAPATGAETQP